MRRLLAGALGLYFATTAVTIAARPADPGPQAQGAAKAAARSGADIYAEACIACHGADGRGTPRTVVGFDAPLPDFSDCAFATGEPDPDWYAVVHQGGPVRALDRHMPAFGGALSSDDITRVLGHLRTFCDDPAWPRGDLNLPRAFYTEKAFPENETVWETAFVTGDAPRVGNQLVYERRIGSRGQIEVIVPVDFQQEAGGAGWVRGLGDVAFGFKRALYASVANGRIAAAGAEVILPTGNEARGLGNGFTVFEPFAMWGQVLPKNWFLQMHGGIELPSDAERGTREAFLRTGLGTTVAQEAGFGRAWSPQVELLWAKPEGEAAEWDVVPQIQITLSKLQHVMVAVGVRIPVTQRGERPTQGLVYLLWDWFDGSFFDFWK
jgi:mono/diheme cytochrome c family protein